MRQSTPKSQWFVESRAGFTLVELLVVISILLILMVMTVSAVNFTLNDEKVGSATRQIQSFLEGARSRAIRSKAPVGVRFFRDTELNGTDMVTTMAYIAPGDTWDEGTIRLERSVPAAAVADTVAGNWETFWWELYKRDQLELGMRIKIPNSPSGSWYTITGFNSAFSGSGPAAFDPSDPYPLQMTISPAYRDPATSPAGQQIAFSDGGPGDYSLELPPRILPRQPVLLPDGTCLDLLSSKNLPLFSSQPATSSTSQHFDIMFAPRGTVIGAAASTGLIHFYVGEVPAALAFRDYLTNSPPAAAISVFVPPEEFVIEAGGNAEPVGRRAIVSLYTQTGSIVSVPEGVDPTDADSDGLADDPYFFAETAVEAVN